MLPVHLLRRHDAAAHHAHAHAAAATASGRSARSTPRTRSARSSVSALAGSCCFRWSGSRRCSSRVRWSTWRSASLLLVRSGRMAGRRAWRPFVRGRWRRCARRGRGVALVPLRQDVLASGVYRTGTLPSPEDACISFYRDGRTATVSVRSRTRRNRLYRDEWKARCLARRRSGSAPAIAVAPGAARTATRPRRRCFPSITLAHMPKAQNAAVIGQGSGMTSHLLLGSATPPAAW